jgi:hypothetical protein
MSYPLNYPTPQNANVQIFQAANDQNTGLSEFTWVKPQGASFVWFTLIGPGGPGDAATGGGSGAVTNFMCPAFLIPDSLSVSIPLGYLNNSYNTEIRYQQKNGSGYLLLSAARGGFGTGGAAMTANYFTAMGFFQSIAGQAGSSTSISASTTTFLSGGGAASNTQTSNYGYSTNDGTLASSNGFFQMQPIIVGAGSMGTNINCRAVGCGGGISGSGTNGGPGMAVIITW